MPGSSLWLIPPRSSETYNILNNLITSTVPSSFSSLKTFPIHLPHITLTSDVPEAITSLPLPTRQQWFHRLPLTVPTAPIVRFESIEEAQRLTKKLSIHVAKSDSLVDLAIQMRMAVVEKGDADAARRWVLEEWVPHVSLLYADTEVGEEKRREITRKLKEAGVIMEKYGGEVEGDGCQRCDGWVGGSLLWMDTRGEIEEWTVIEERKIESEKS